MRASCATAFGDLDELLLSDAQVLDQRARIDAGLQPLQQFARAPFLQSMIDPERSAGQFSRREYVLGDREISEQIQFLKYDAYAMPRRIGGVGERDGLAVERDPARSRAFDAGDDLHQGRLAGAVLADEHVDRAATNLEIDLLDRDRAGIDLRHPL